MVKALTWRIGLSVGLFVLLIVAYYAGLDRAARQDAERPDRRGRAAPRSQPVDEAEQPEPHHVDEVPVPGHRLEGEVAAAA